MKHNIFINMGSLIKLLIIYSIFFLKKNIEGFKAIVTNNPICTDMAKNYIDKYPTISMPELFIITSVCEDKLKCFLDYKLIDTYLLI